MEIFLLLATFLPFCLLPVAAPLALRCGLSACLRFSPRAAIALASLSGLCGYAAALLMRGGFSCVRPRLFLPVSLCAIVGGTVGRMILLMFTARFSGSLALACVQAAPLFVLCTAALISARLPFPGSRIHLVLLASCCAWIEGFFGCGGALLFHLATGNGVRRRQDAPQSAVLLLGMVAQLSAILLTLLCGAAEILPMRMLFSLAVGAVLGASVFEHRKKRGAIRNGLRAALLVYLLFAALAGVEQAYWD